MPDTEVPKFWVYYGNWNQSQFAQIFLTERRAQEELIYDAVASQRVFDRLRWETLREKRNNGEDCSKIEDYYDFYAWFKTLDPEERMRLVWNTLAEMEDYDVAIESVPIETGEFIWPPL